MHLLAHYELGNDMIIESLTKSVYRFMAKMKNLSAVEEAIFVFLRKSINLPKRQVKAEMEKLLDKVKQYENNPLQTRTFAYLDVISYLEAKVEGKPMGLVLQEKYKKSRRK
jgi:hypothetical protein